MSDSLIPLAAPTGAHPGRSGVPAAMLGALAAGLLALPGQARADSYGHAEITLGFPHGAVTVGRTWEEHPRQVVVEEVTHKYPEADDEAYADEEDDDVAYDDRSDDADVVIEKRIVRPAPRKVTIIERYVEPEPCDRVVVRKVYVESPACSRRDVVYYGRPAVRVMHGGPTVIVAPGRAVWHGRGHGGGYRSHGGYRDEGPRNLFPEDGGRPVRSRGVSRSLVQVGAHSH